MRECFENLVTFYLSNMKHERIKKASWKLVNKGEMSALLGSHFRSEFSVNSYSLSFTLQESCQDVKLREPCCTCAMTVMLHACPPKRYAGITKKVGIPSSAQFVAQSRICDNSSGTCKSAMRAKSNAELNLSADALR